MSIVTIIMEVMYYFCVCQIDNLWNDAPKLMTSLK